MMTAQQIADRLNDRFRLLTGGRRTALPRQQTLQALIDWSWNLLTEPEQLLWQRLSVFSGGWTLNAEQEVAGFAPLDELGVFDGLEQELGAPELERLLALGELLSLDGAVDLALASSA